jgi:ABC-type branched-subunit amino acid transport system substrate-binding protein
MKHGRKLIALLFAFALIVAACGDDEGDTTTTTAGGGETPTTTAAGTPTTSGGTDTTAAPPTEIATDKGVDLDAGTIKIGMLSDLTGAFGPLVSAIVTGHEVYWENVNRNGGVNGLQVELVVRDTQYVVDNHVQLYEELKDQVVAFGHSTGSPHTVAINSALQDDGILAIPLTWYSGWSDPAINANLVPHGAPYCIEAMNLLEYTKGVANEAGIADPKLAIASLPGDYGLDSAAGAALAAAALELEVVYDGSGQIIPGQDLTPIANEIVGSGADIVFVTATPGTFTEVYGPAIAQGFEAIWTGAAPTYNPAFLDSAVADAIQRDFIASFYAQPWGSDNPGMQEMMALFAELRPDAAPNDYYGEGFVEAKIMHDALLAAYANGDLTQAGVLNAAKSLELVDFNGLAPNETYVGSANERLQREIVLIRPDKALKDAGGTGANVIDPAYTSDLAAGYEFTAACFQL